MPAYAEQLLISTGKRDWTSRIEEDASGEMVRLLKAYLGNSGKYSNPFHNVMLTHSSFASSELDLSRPTASAYLFPSFRYIPSIPLDSATVEKFIQAFVLPEGRTSDRGDTTTPADVTVRKPELQALFPRARDVSEILVLICSHESRDSRCGIIGPILQDEFEQQLARYDLKASASVDAGEKRSARVGLISHIGGHRWAGNVIIYLPKWMDHALAGTGIWYGRVAPQHVEGIIEQTILRGKIIRDMFRGGIDAHRKILRL